MKHLEDEEFEAKLCEFLDIIVHRPKMETACRAIGYSGKNIWRWLKRSAANDPKFLVRWPDRESEQQIQFCDAVMQARKMWRVVYDSTLREDVTIGVPEVQTFQGEVVWEKDAEALVTWGGDTIEAREAAERLGGLVDYPFKHRYNLNGKLERVPLQVYKTAPASLRQHVARSLLPEQYNPPEVRSVSTEHSSAVMIVGATRPPYAKDYAAPPATTESPFRLELHERLAELKARGPIHRVPLDASGRKTMPKVGNGSASNDPPEGLGRGAVPSVDADGVVHHQRSQSGPIISKDGKAAPGGYSLTTGKPT